MEKIFTRADLKAALKTATFHVITEEEHDTLPGASDECLIAYVTDETFGDLEISLDRGEYHVSGIDAESEDVFVFVFTQGEKGKGIRIV
jgi:hypothetical protein